MKLTINGRFLGRPVTGVERFATEVVRVLDQLVAERHTAVAGVQISIVMPSNVAPRERFDALPMRHTGFGRGQFWEQVSLPAATVGQLLLSLCNTGPIAKSDHWVVVHDAAPRAAPSGYGAAFRAWYSLLQPALARSARGVLTVSNFSASELRRWYGMAPAQVHALPPEGREHVLRVQPDVGILARHGLLARPFVLAVSSAQPNKNFGLIVQAACLLGDAGFDLVIAGGTQPGVFAQSTWVLPANVRHVGYVTDAELVALYGHAACFVFPSRYEGFGLPPVEAMALGCPVLCASTASLPEVCGDAARYFDPDDAPALAALLQATVANGQVRASMAAAGHVRVANYEWRRLTLRLLEIIQAGQKT